MSAYPRLELSLSRSPLDQVLKRAGAHMAERHGWLVAADFGSLASELAVSRAVAGLADVSSIAKFELRGDEHALAAMRPSERSLGSCCAVRAWDGWWLPLSPELLLVMGVPGLGPGPRRELEERAVRHGVELRDVTTSRVAVCVLGPAAREVLTRAGAQVLPVGSVRSESIDGIPTLVLHEDEQRWLLLAPAADAAELWSALSDAGAPLGLAYVGADALQHLLVARPR